MLTPLPTDFPAALLVLQHQWPHTKSTLGDILAQHTLLMPQGTIALIKSGPVPPYRPSADLLLTSLALAVGRQAIAVIWSGHDRRGDWRHRRAADHTYRSAGTQSAAAKDSEPA